MTTTISLKPTESESSSSSPEVNDMPPLESAMEVVLMDNQEEEEQQQPPEENSPENYYTKRIVGIFLLGFVSFVVADSLTNQYIKQGLTSFLEWMQDNPLPGFFTFVCLLFFTTLLFIPGALMTLGAGYVFNQTFELGLGVVLGTIAVFVGSASGALVSFLMGRFLLRDCVAGLTNKFKVVQALDSALETNGFQILALLRLSPLIYVSPYLNYGMGGSAVSISAYTLSLLAILPGTVMYVFLGASAKSLTEGEDEKNDQNQTFTLVTLIIGIVLSVIAVVWTSYYAKKELDKITARNNAAHAAASVVQDDEEEVQLAQEREPLQEVELPACASNHSSERF